MPTYPFTENDMRAAAEAWGCNCGPSALAFALQKPLDAARYAIPRFESKGYTSPSMMSAALKQLHQDFTSVPKPTVNEIFSGRMALVRIQWTGPWTHADANPRWAYRQTHWIATWTERRVPLLFDCNGGIQGFSRWEDDIVPALTSLYPRADGGWRPTHVWRLTGSEAITDPENTRSEA